MRKIGTHPRFSLPFAAVEVAKGEQGERVIEGVKPFNDSLPNVPFFKRDHTTGQTVRISSEERKGMAAGYSAERERKAKKRAKLAAYSALSTEEQEKIDAKKASATEKRAVTKAAKKAAEVTRAPHTFVRVIRPQSRFIPPPALDKPEAPPPIVVKEETTLESEETRKARQARLEAYKTKQRPAWFTDSHARLCKL